MTHVGSLPESVESVLHAVIGCGIAVHRELGPGYLEMIYRKAMMIELDAQRIPFEAEKAILVPYREFKIPGQRIDLLVGGLVVVELKAVAAIEPVHVAQVLSYLKATGLGAGLVINFHAPLLRDGIRRVVREASLRRP